MPLKTPHLQFLTRLRDVIQRSTGLQPPLVHLERVAAAMQVVNRQDFIPEDLIPFAGLDQPLPIGYEQTISQPSLVATMTAMLQIEPGDRALEIGTGSGYQAAILAQLTDHVYTIETIPELAEQARQRFDALGYTMVKAICRDGYFGWPEYAPYDAIIVTAAAPRTPPPLLEQLSPDGGRLVIPIGPAGEVQKLYYAERRGAKIRSRFLFGVRFVPFTRRE